MCSILLNVASVLRESEIKYDLNDNITYLIDLTNLQLNLSVIGVEQHGNRPSVQLVHTNQVAKLS